MGKQPEDEFLHKPCEYKSSGCSQWGHQLHPAMVVLVWWLDLILEVFPTEMILLPLPYTVLRAETGF